MICLDFHRYLPYIVSYTFVLVLNFFIKANVDALWDKVVGRAVPNRQPWHPQFIGILELTMYLSAFIYDRPEFIFAWITVKTVPSITYWNKNRTLFNLFLIGNALAIIISYAGFRIFESVKVSMFIDGILIGAITICFLVTTFFYSKSMEPLNIDERDDSGRGRSKSRPKNTKRSL